MCLKALGQHATLGSSTTCMEQRDEDLVAALDSLEPDDGSAWRSRELQVWKGVKVIAAVPGALALYWRAFRWTLHGGNMDSTLKPANLLSCSNGLHSVALTEGEGRVPMEFEVKSLHAALSVLLQLTQGCSELSGLSLAFMKSGNAKADAESGRKKKKKESAGKAEGDMTSLSPHSSTSLRNMILKLNGICEVSYIDFGQYMCSADKFSCTGGMGVLAEVSSGEGAEAQRH